MMTDKLQRVMNAAACIISNTQKFDHGLTQLLRDILHWLDVADRITFRLCVYVFLCLPWRHRTCPNCAGLFRSLKDVVIGGHRACRTSLQSSNLRQTCDWLRRTESVELTSGLLEMRRPQSRNIQTTVKDVFVRTLLAHSAH